MDWMLRIVTFELAEAACCMPSHADWLNDLSLMPPVSVTMQPRNLPDVEPPAAPLAPPPVADAADDGALDVLLPQAASRRLAVAAAAAVIIAVCFTRITSTGRGSA